MRPLKMHYYLLTLDVTFKKFTHYIRTLQCINCYINIIDRIEVRYEYV